jgi:predicted PurR-regulated permease PerM
MQPQKPTTQTSAKKIPKWLKVIAVIIVILVLFFLSVFLLANQATKNAVKVSNQLVSDIQTNDTTAAYTLTAPDFQKATSQDQMSQILAGISPALQGTVKVTGKAIRKVSGQPNQATIIYTIQTNGDTKYIRVVLQGNNPWQVLNFRSSDTPLDTSSTN